MAAECCSTVQKWDRGGLVRPGSTTCTNDRKKKQQEPRSDVFAELSRVGYEGAHVVALKRRIGSLQNRLEALEKHHREEKTKQNRFVLRELVKGVRARIVEVNGILPPSSKQSWKYCLHNLTPQQLQQANVNVRSWPEIIEILSPSAVKLNAWVHGYTAWQAAQVIDGMNSEVQSTWAELFKMTHGGESFEDYAKLGEPTMAEELHEHD